MDQVSLTGDAIAAVVLGCVGTGQGLGDELGEVDERSLNWRAEPASHARLECTERRATKGRGSLVVRGGFGMLFA